MQLLASGSWKRCVHKHQRLTDCCTVLYITVNHMEFRCLLLSWLLRVVSKRTLAEQAVLHRGQGHKRTRSHGRDQPPNAAWLIGSQMQDVRTCTQSCPLVIRSLRTHADSKFEPPLYIAALQWCLWKWLYGGNQQNRTLNRWASGQAAVLLDALKVKTGCPQIIS